MPDSRPSFQDDCRLIPFHLGFPRALPLRKRFIHGLIKEEVGCTSTIVRLSSSPGTGDETELIL